MIERFDLDSDLTAANLCVAHQELEPAALNGRVRWWEQEEQTIHCVVELEGTHTRGQTVCDWGCFDGLQAER